MKAILLLCLAAQEPGIAAKYPDDAGIGKDPRVLFADNFDEWLADSDRFPPGTWDSRRDEVHRKRIRSAVPGRITIGDREASGKNVLLLACWKGGEQTSGHVKLIGNYRSRSDGKGFGHEEVCVRYYQKLDLRATAVQNHGANLGGRDVTRPGSWFVGQAGTRDVAGQGYFFSGLQPYPDVDRMFWGLYSYHMDKPTQWGDDYKPRPEEKVTVQPGRWYCLERRMRLNAVDKADGLEELWVDGKLVLRREGLKFRRVPELKIACFNLEVYYHNLPDRYTEDAPIKAYFDNLVIATERIGPLVAKP